MSGPTRARRTARLIELNLELALTSAHCGDYELLRKLYPHLAEHLNPPRLKRGQKRKRWTSLSSVDLAAQDVRKVRSLFQKAYGRRRRSRGDWSVEAIVAAVYNIYFLSRGEAKFTEDAIMARLKPSGKHKTPRRKARGK